MEEIDIEKQKLIDRKNKLQKLIQEKNSEEDSECDDYAPKKKK